MYQQYRDASKGEVHGKLISTQRSQRQYPGLQKSAAPRLMSINRPQKNNNEEYWCDILFPCCCFVVFSVFFFPHISFLDKIELSNKVASGFSVISVSFCLFEMALG